MISRFMYSPRGIRLSGLFLAVVGLLVFVLGYYRLQHRLDTDLPRYGSVPTFSLLERSGRTITQADLAGRIWVASFIYTTCPGPCPIITANIARLQNRYATDPRLQFVSFTVDPRDDTVPVLKVYANARGADPQRWWFLTGPQQTVEDLVEKGFFQVIVDNHGKTLEPGQFLITHSTQIVLVDPKGFIRGFYDGLGKDENAPLIADIGRLEREFR